ncbi:MAG: dephospho-CoA kinase [Verrucomicrobiota bacterium]|nr:dephospho-CoA kinase [Verrucomicrobiota bacterium]
MLKLKKIAITGGVASGKSTVCQLFQELGAFVVSADAIVHELLDPQTDLGQQIIRILGASILQHGKINRRLVAEKVFQDPKRLHQLEQILHPAVLESVKNKYQEACQAGIHTAFVVEIPLLFEIGKEKEFDAIIAVIADEEIAKQRFQQKGHTSLEYEQRMSHQISPSIKSQKAHSTIINNGSIPELRQQVKKLAELYFS